MLIETEEGMSDARLSEVSLMIHGIVYAFVRWAQQLHGADPWGTYELHVSYRIKSELMWQTKIE